MSEEFPQFYEVDDTTIRVDLDPSTNEVFGVVMATGLPYRIGKVLVEGHQISEEEANRLTEIRKQDIAVYQLQSNHGEEKVMKGDDKNMRGLILYEGQLWWVDLVEWQKGGNPAVSIVNDDGSLRPATAKDGSLIDVLWDSPIIRRDLPSTEELKELKASYCSPRLKKAVHFAYEAHRGQNRKGTDIPYIVHPFAVAHILAKIGNTEDVVIAGLLHDTIEDSLPERKVTKSTIANEFGAHVADIVESVTERDKSLPWEERKSEALQNVTHLSEDALLVKSADLISNISDILADYKEIGEKIFERFNGGRRLLAHYEQIVSAIVEHWPENPLKGDLEDIRIQLQRIEGVSNSQS